MIDFRFKDLDNIELINLFKSNKDEIVFKEIYLRYKDMLFGYIKRFLYNQPDDIIQELINEVFIKVYLKLPKLKNVYAFKVWLYRIARNISINYAKSNKFPYISLDNEDNSLVTDDITDSRINVEDKYINNETRKVVFNELNKLDNKIREIIILKFFDNLTFQEIADITKMSVRTLKNKVKSGFITINQTLKKTGYI